MKPTVRKFFDMHLIKTYKRPAPLILVNGLAEQSESWFANRSSWSRQFDVKVPELLVYDGDALHRHIDGGGEVTIDYLTDRLATYLDEFVQHPPYHLV
ncbi:MAG: alpha/beta hydrolase, partial [Alphaproteobacteria bacterium]|nr:alpha/beta hydrolase [Alphaproteobacteria bacterium]